MAYVDPGEAGLQGFQGYLLNQQLQQQRQQELAMKKQQVDLQIQAGQEALAEKKQESQARMDDRARAETERDVANLQPGDFLTDTDLVARAHKYHVPLRLAAPEMNAAATAPAPPPMLAAPGQEGTSPLPQDQTNTAPPEGQPPAALTPAGLGPGTYQGTPAYQEQQRQKNVILKLAASPGLDPAEQKALEYEAATGKNAPAGMFKATAPAGVQQPVYRTSPDRSKIEKLGPDGQFTQVTSAADIDPKGHWLNEPPPKDTTGADLRRDAAVQRARESAYREVENIEKPIRAHTDSLNELGVMLNQNTPVADSVIAPLVIKSTIAGMGSGFRMTQGEIDKVIHSRSAWEDLRAKLLHWSANPTEALAITPAQRDQMRQLAIAARKLANDQVSKINTARGDIDSAEEIGDVNKARTRLHNALNESNAEEAKTTNKKSADDYLKEAGIIK